MNSRKRTLIVAMIAAILAPLAAAQAPDPAWRALPDDTLFALRMPGINTFVQAMRARTRFGAVTLSDERMGRLTAALNESMGEQWEQMVDTAGQYNLRPDDWKLIGEGPAGIGMVNATDDNGRPFVVTLFWLQPGGDLAPRLVDAALRRAEELIAMDSEFGTTRIDFDYNGHSITHLTMPVVDLDVDMNFEWPENWEELSDEQMQALFQAQQDRVNNAEQIEIDRGHFMFTQSGGRIIGAFTQPQSADYVRELMAEGREADLSAVTGAEATTATLARFLGTIDADGDGGFARRILSTSGLTDTLPQGVPLFDLYINAARFLQLAEQEIDDEEQLIQMLDTFEALGINGAGLVAYGASLDGQAFRQNGFVSLPAPRRGVVSALLDQEPLDPTPPAWVGLEAIDYVHVGVDLGRAYAQIKEVVLNLFEDELGMFFAQIEQQVMGTTGADLATVLSGMGSRHTALVFESRMADVEVPEWDEEAEEVRMVTTSIPQDRMAFVWQPSNPELWQRILQVAGQSLSAMGANAEFVEEQGFAGWRVSQEMMPVALLQGRGFFVVTTGDGVSEQVLASLRTPPQGPNGLRGSDLFAAAGRVMNLRPSVMLSIRDTERSVNNSRQVMSETMSSSGQGGMGMWEMMLTSMTDSGDESFAEFLQALVKIIPSESETRGMFGVQAGQLYVTDQGIILEGAVDLPAP